MAPTLAELDARSRSWPFPARLLYRTVKWSLVALGAFAFVGHFASTLGWSATLWFLLAPLAYGLYLGFTSRQPPPGSSTPAPH